MKLAVVLVHYHTPELLRSACDALIEDAAASDIELEGCVVDNGSRASDEELLRSLPFRCVTPQRNLGYAGGANLGLRESSAELAVVMNPDVRVQPGCLATLIDALESGSAACGPRFFWDDAKRFLLPPTERVSRRAELLRVMAERRGGRWATLGRRAWRAHARCHWLARDPIESYDLSGALLAFRRSAWARIGPFDEGYRLYFEETDWLQRLRRAGLKAHHVPNAEAVHLYAQSVPRQGRAAEWFLESNRRFRRQVYGRIFTAFLEILSRQGADDGPGRSPADGEGAGAPGVPAWLEVSPSVLGYPAAGRLLAVGAPKPTRDSDARAGLPEEIWQRLAPGTYFSRTVDEGGRELDVRTFTKEPGAPKGRRN